MANQHTVHAVSSEQPPPPTDEAGIATLKAVFSVQKNASRAAPTPNYAERLAVLKTLLSIIKDHADDFAQALQQDFGYRSHHEIAIAEINASVSSIRYLIKNLKGLMRNKVRRTSMWYLPAKNYVTYQPLGVIGIMSPWNYPLHLTIAPMAAALAAGNNVMVKMSELTPNTAKLLQSLVSKHYERIQAYIAYGEVDVSIAFSSLAFDHLLFTGSTEVGRHIAAAAGKNLTPVTLELSGKSPVILTGNYDVEEAAKRIIWGKSFNSGQTCVAPDYVLVPKDRLIEFNRACRQAFRKFFPDGIDQGSYTSLVNRTHCLRQENLVKDASAAGATVLPLGEVSKLGEQNRYPVTLVVNPDTEAKINSTECFGPLLTVYSYDELDDAIALIQNKEDPLALYIFSTNKAETNYIIRNTRAGGVTVNDTLLHYLQDDLPFGGVGSSGSGRYHGKEGFELFSNKKAVLVQRGFGNFTGVKLLYPPYGTLANIMIKTIRRLT